MLEKKAFLSSWELGKRQEAAVNILKAKKRGVSHERSRK